VNEELDPKKTYFIVVPSDGEEKGKGLWSCEMERMVADSSGDNRSGRY